MDATADVQAGRGDTMAGVALASAVLGVAAVVVMYWLVLPAVILGLVGVVLAVVARRRGLTTARARDFTMAAICLGAVAILFTPVALMVASGAEDWGRDCALNPDQDPNCPKPAGRR